MQPEEMTPDDWIDSIDARLFEPGLKPLECALKALEACPEDPVVMEYAAFAALVEGKPDLALRLVKKLVKSYLPLPGNLACQALALAQQGKWPLAQSILDKLPHARRDYGLLFPDGLDRRWVDKWVGAIDRWRPREPERKTRDVAGAGPKMVETGGSPEGAVVTAPAVAPLPVFPARIPMRFEMPAPQDYDLL